MNARVHITEDEVMAQGETAQLRVPPNSVEAESSVLAGLLLEASAWDRVGDLIAEADFYRREHRLVFASIAALANATRPVDVLTVFEHLRSLGKADEAGGLPYLTALSQYVPSAANIRRYAEIVREKAILRHLISTSDEIATAAFNPQGQSAAQLLDEAERKILGLGDARQGADDDWEDNATGIVRLLDRINDESSGHSKPDLIPTGLKDLDERLDGGMRPGELLVVGARPSMGKSALGLTIGINTAMAGEPTGMFSMEMPRTQVHNRMLSVVSHIHLSRIKRAERLKDFDWPELTKGVDVLRQLPFFVNDQSGLTIGQVRTKARRLKRQRGLRVLVVDYLGLMVGTDPKQPRTYQIEDITKGLKVLAKELGMAVILLVQLSRKVEERVDQMPMLSDLRDSGAIEQDADVVIFVHRPHKAKPDLADEWKYYAKVSVAKVRDGDPGFIDLMYVGENTRFLDWPTDQPVPTSQVRVARASTTKAKEL